MSNGTLTADAERPDKQLQACRKMGEATISIVLVDDQATVRRGLRMRLTIEADVEVVGEAGSGEAALRLVRSLSPNVVLMDVEMPGMDGIDATAALRAAAPQVAVVVLSLYDDARTRARAREAGAAAFVAKHQAKTTLLATIRRVVSSIERRGPP
jgi:two-component system, NarL family, response regulator DesR